METEINHSDSYHIKLCNPNIHIKEYEEDLAYKTFEYTLYSIDKLYSELMKNILFSIARMCGATYWKMYSYVY